MEEVDKALKFGRKDDGVFPILLVLSDINWKPLEDFYRIKPIRMDRLSSKEIIIWDDIFLAQNPEGQELLLGQSWFGLGGL